VLSQKLHVVSFYSWRPYRAWIRQDNKRADLELGECYTAAVLLHTFHVVGSVWDANANANTVHRWWKIMLKRRPEPFEDAEPSFLFCCPVKLTWLSVVEDLYQLADLWLWQVS
jgi:hypothetical protein